MASSKGIKAGRAYVELGVDDRIAAGLRRAQRRLRAFGSSVRATGQALARATVIPSAGLALSVKLFSDFDDRMRVVRSVTGATAVQFAQLRDEAKRLGAETSFSARQVADAMAELGRAGFNPEQVLSATESVLALSRATSTELARATEIAGAALRGFNLDVSDMTRVSDVLTATANGSAQTLEDLFEALKPVAPIAAEAGESLEQTAAAVAVLANNGIKGSLAGSSLARAYKNLATELKQSELAEFGVQAIDAQGNLRSLAIILNELSAATKGFGSAQRLSIFESLFGRGQAAALKLASSGEAFTDLVETITGSSGAAQAAAQEMDAGVGGSFRKLASAAEGVAIAIGEAIREDVKKATDRITSIGGTIRGLIGQNQGLITSIFKVTLGVGALAIGLIGAGLAITLAGSAVGGLATLFTGLVAVVGALISPVALATTAFAGFIGLVATQTNIGAVALKFLGDTFGRLASFAGTTIDAIRNAILTGDLALAVEIVGKDMELAWTATLGSMKNQWIDLQSFLKQTGFDAATKFDQIKAAFDLGLDTVQNDLSSFASFVGGLASFPGISQEEIAGIKATDSANAAQAIDQYIGKVAGNSKVSEFAEFFKSMIDTYGQQQKEAADKIRNELKAAIENLKNREPAAPADQAKFGKLADLAGVLEAAANDFGQREATAGGITSRGTFNASALSGLGGSGQAKQLDRTATATEKTASNTSKLIKKIQELPGQARFA